MNVEIDGVKYVPENQAQIKLGQRVFTNPERMLWEIYSWYTHRLSMVAQYGNQDEIRRYVEDAELFEECVKKMFGMHIERYEFVEDER